MNYALIIIYVLVAISLLIKANQHGKLREGKHNFFTNAIFLLIELCLIWWALGWQFT